MEQVAIVMNSQYLAAVYVNTDLHSIFVTVIQTAQICQKLDSFVLKNPYFKIKVANYTPHIDRPISCANMLLPLLRTTVH